MAGEQPKEGTEPIGTPSDAPGAFPVTPANELDMPIGINPLPATDGAVNPITLGPGEKIPETITAQSTNEHVKLDKESYEKSDALAGVDLSLPPVTSNTIPESSLPISGSNDVTINSVGPESTTTALAGQVPLEPKVPKVVKESQAKAGVDPEASAVAEEVREKAEVEDELKKKVHEAPSTSEGTAGVGTDKKDSTGGVVAAAVSAKDTIAEKATPAVNNNLPDPVKDKLPVAAQEALTGQTKEETREEVSPEVPTEVKESIVESGKSPEAAASTSAVADKAAVEAELKKEVSPVPAEGDIKAEEAKPETSEPVAIKPLDPAPETPAKVETPANGAGSKVAEPAASSSKTPETATEKKKKNRLSTVFSKIKHKLSDKN